MKKLCILLLLTTIISAQEFGDAGSMEAGGRVYWNTSVDEGNSSGHFVIEPLFNWFFSDNIYLAAKVHGDFSNNGSVWTIGAGVGYLWDEPETLYPYIDLGLGITYNSWWEKAGVSLPMNLGVKFPIYNHVTIDAGGYVQTTIIDSNASANIGIAGGITVMIF